jgi:hypothetical protein
VRLRFAIPLAILLLIATSYASGFLPFNAYYVLVGTSAIWAAIDSHRVGVEQYNSSLALPPIGILAVVTVLWPITFPAYLKLRYRVQRGDVALGLSRTSRFRWWILAGAVGIGLSALIVFWRSPTIQQLALLATDLKAEFRVPVDVSLTAGRNLSLTVYAVPPLSDSMRAEWAKSMARFARDRYAQASPLQAVTVILVDQHQRGAIIVTRQLNRYVWSVEQIRDSESANSDDDKFARAFLENVRTQNIAGAAQLNPSSTINANGWEGMAGFRASFPKGQSRSVRPVGWEILADSSGESRKLVYRIESQTDTALAEIWLVDVAGHTYVDTFRMRSPVNNAPSDH